MQKKPFKVPHTYVILFSLIILAALASYVVPSGQYELIEKTMLDGSSRKVVDPSTFRYVEKSSLHLFEILKSIPKGMTEAASIIFFIFILGGSFQVINATGAIENGIKNLALRFRGKEKLMIPAIVFIFSIGGGTIGMAEEAILFVPIGIALARSLGYDAIVGMSVVALGAAVGFVSGFMNPFTVGVAQGIAELPIYSGIVFRLIIWGASFLLVTFYITHYANKVKKNPEYSYVRELELSERENSVDFSDVQKITGPQKIILLGFLASIGIIIYGVLKYGWFMTEICSVFLGLGIFSGIVGKLGSDKICSNFIDGVKDIAVGALVVGLARGILVVLTEGSILDTIVHALASVVSSFPKSISAAGMFLVQSVLNFIIPSGSGQAATTMPIMTPLADVIGLTRQTAVLAFHLGDGISNSIIPTSGVLMANLAVAKIDYEKWVRFVAPLMIYWTLMSCIFMVIAAAIHYGPF